MCAAGVSGHVKMVWLAPWSKKYYYLDFCDSILILIFSGVPEVKSTAETFV